MAMFVHSFIGIHYRIRAPHLLNPNLTQLKKESEKRVKVRRRMTVKGTGGEAQKAAGRVATLVMSGFVSAPHWVAY